MQPVATSTITVIPVNDAPTISGLPGSAVTYTEGATAATLMVGNSVPPPVAEALTRANLNDNAPQLERVAA